MYRDSHPFWFPSRSLFFLFLKLFFQAASFHGDRSTNKQCQSPSFLKDVQRQSFLGVRFARAFSGRRTWEIRAFTKDGPSELPTSDILASSGAPALGVRLPCWEFRGPSGSSSRVHGSLNSARIFIVGSPCSFLGLLSVGIFLASARLRSRSDVPKTHAPGARHLLRNRPQARRVKRVSGIFISKENQHRIHYRSTVVCVLPYQLPSNAFHTEIPLPPSHHERHPKQECG